MAVAGSIAYQLTLDAQGFVKNIAAAEGGLSKFKSSMMAATGMIAAFGAALAGFRGLKGLMTEIWTPFEEGFRLRNLSKQTNETIGNLFRFEWGLKAVGLETSQAGMFITRFQKALGGINEEGKPTAFTFGMMGLKIRELQKMDTFKAFDLWAEKLKTLNRTSAAFVATTIMGGARYGGGQFLALARSITDVQEAMRRAGQQAEIFQKFGYTFYEIVRRLQLIKDTLRGFFVGIGAGASGGLLFLLREFDSFLQRNQAAMLSFGRKIGEIVSVLAEAFKEGAIGDTLKKGFMAAVEAVANFMLQILGSIGAFAITLGINISEVVTDHFRVNLTNVMVSAFQTLTAMMRRSGLITESMRDRGVSMAEEYRQQPSNKQVELSSLIEALKNGFLLFKDYFGTARQKEFGAIWDKFMKAAQRLVEIESGPGPADKGSILGGLYHLPQTAIEKMGFTFSGGPLAIGMDYARMTADNTRQMLFLQSQTNALLGGAGSAGLGNLSPTKTFR